MKQDRFFEFNSKLVVSLDGILCLSPLNIETITTGVFKKSTYEKVSFYIRYKDGERLNCVDYSSNWSNWDEIKKGIVEKYNEFRLKLNIVD